MTEQTKICTRCKVEKPLSEYHLRSKKEPYLKSACIECHRERARGYWRAKPLPKEVQRERNLQRAFGIGVEEYNDLLKAQGNCCAICNKDESLFTRRLAVDHCHTTGKVRGLLCIYCNTALGKFEDNETLLQAAIEYLKRNKHGE